MTSKKNSKKQTMQENSDSSRDKKDFNFETKKKEPTTPNKSESNILTGYTETSYIADSLLSLALGRISRTYPYGVEWTRNVQAARDEVYYRDPEVHTAINKRLERLLGAKITIKAKTTELEEEILSQLMLNNNMENLKSWVFKSITDQFSVIENVWNKDPDGKYRLREFREMNNEDFRPHQDGKNVYYSDGKKEEIAPFGKYILVTNRGSIKNVWGESVLDPIVELHKIRSNASIFWAKWVERYGLGFFDVTIQGSPSRDKVEKFKEELDKAILGGTVVHSSDVGLDIVYPTGSGEQFERFNNSIIDCYNRLILGETSTSRINNGNSSTAAAVHDQQGNRRANRDALYLKKAVDRFIYYYYVINDMELKDIPKCEIVFEQGIQLERARRDYLLTQMQNFNFTKDYYIRTYGFRESDFEILPGYDEGGNPSNRNDADIDTNEGRGGSPDTRRGSSSFKHEFATKVVEKAKREQSAILERFEGADKLLEVDLSRIEKAIKDATSAEEVIDSLALIFADSDNIELQNSISDTLLKTFSDGYKK